MKWRPVLDEDTINWRDNVHVRAAQMTSIEALAARDSDRFSPALETDWLAVAQQRGFVKSSGYIDTGALMTKMNDLYGGAYLEATSLDMVAKQSAPWVVRLLKCSHTLFHPLQYILMAHLLRQCEGPNRRAEVAPRLRTNQPIVCPNSYAAHEPKHAVEEVRVTETADRQQVGHARCICGLRFTFSRCEADGETPCDVQITKYGHDWANAVRAMHGQGHSYPAIERSMGLPPRAALRMSKRLGDQKRSKPTPAQLLQCRREWRQTLRKVAPGGHLLAAQRNKLLYNRLREFDRDWLTRSAQRRGQPRRKASEMEWKRRDREWRTRLETAAAKLRGLDSPAVRVSKAAMAAEAGVWVLGASVRNKLPLCHAALRDLAESAEQFQIRRLEVARMRLSACSQEVTRWKLLKLACISRVLNPIVEAALTELEIKNVTRHSPARAPVD
ncbi:TnsD family Tn7-like transposition protein [Caballeronia sp. LZ008]|uniref:TnsD family Tn7-like transposition protein n=1 Tax=unclassified Caballeronia TaxID=2646786 RepID=UPI002028C7D1|nr:MULTISPECIES: TnsD family Tn7-like transposition protein [unclassified Caballeronia]MDR5796497.1 TnsD family Tn7-like transposition protein [Caballeronia sp. LZ008]